MNNKIVIGIVSLIVVFVLVFFAYKLTNTSQPTLFPDVNKVQVTDHIKWSTDKKNILVEYSDLQCPACKVFHDMIKQQIETTQSGQIDVSKKITFIYRHFPLYPNPHPNSQSAAYAAEAAGKQGKFFEFADKLFNNQTDWADKSDPASFYLKYAEELKLDIDKFKQDMVSKETKDKVAADVLSGQNAGLNATPTFYLNGQKLDNIQSFNDFKQLLIDTSKK